MIPVIVNYKYFTLYKASSLNLAIICSKGVAFSSFFGAAYLYDKVAVRGCPVQWEVIPFAFIEMDG